MVIPPPWQTAPFKTSLPPACSCFFRGIEFEPSERVREEPPDDRNQKTKKPKLHGECWNSFGFFVFWFVGSLVLCFFCFFCFFVFWFFGSLVFWFFGSLVLWFFESLVFWFFGCWGFFLKYDTLHNETKQPKNQRTKKPKNQKTKEPKNQKTKKKKQKNQRTKEPTNQKTKTVPAFSVELWFFGFLVSVVGWFFTDTFGGFKLDTPEKADWYLY